jgi:DNA-binding SARP family transcriptional activator
VVHVALLGPLIIDTGQGRVLLSAPKERAVLEMLALRAGRVVTVESLHEGLWGDSPPLSAAKTAQTYISHLRRLLPSGTLTTAGRGYVLDVDEGSVDAACFEAALREGRELHRASELHEAADRLADALGLWRGPPCSDLTEYSWASAEVVRLEALRHEAEDETIDVRLGLGEHERLVAEIEASVAAAPLRERRWGQLMLALYRCGRQADALRAFAKLRMQLADELGISPSVELSSLEQAVLMQSPELRYQPASSRPGRGRDTPGHVPMTGRSVWPIPASRFVGRTAELGELAKLLDDHRLVTLAGVGGCGKTRLALELAGQVKDEFPGGAFFVEPASTTVPDLVPVAVAEALAVRPQSERPLADIIGEVLGTRETLVVLDNCEQVVTAVATFADRLLRIAPGLRLLATSRDPLRGRDHLARATANGAVAGNDRHRGLRGRRAVLRQGCRGPAGPRARCKYFGRGRRDCFPPGRFAPGD